MISFHDFRRLWIDAQEIPDLDRYVAEVGGSVPLDDLGQVTRLLALIHGTATGAASDIRRIAGHTQVDMAREYGIPASTVNKWDMGSSSPQPWTRVMIAYAVVSDLLEAEYGDG